MANCVVQRQWPANNLDVSFLTYFAIHTVFEVLSNCYDGKTNLSYKQKKFRFCWSMEPENAWLGQALRNQCFKASFWIKSPKIASHFSKSVKSTDLPFHFFDLFPI